MILPQKCLHCPILLLWNIRFLDIRGKINFHLTIMNLLVNAKRMGVRKTTPILLVLELKSTRNRIQLSFPKKIKCWITKIVSWVRFTLVCYKTRGLIEKLTDNSEIWNSAKVRRRLSIFFHCQGLFEKLKDNSKIWNATKVRLSMPSVLN